MQKTKRLTMLGVILLASVSLAVVAQASGVLQSFARFEDEEIRIETMSVSLILTDQEKATATSIALADSQIEQLLAGADNYTLVVSEVFDVVDFDVQETSSEVALVPQKGVAKVTIQINNDYGDQFGEQTIEVTVDLEKQQITTKDVQPEIVKPKIVDNITELSELIENPENYEGVVVTVTGKVSLLGEVFGSLFELDETVTVFYAHQNGEVDVSDIENGDTVTVTGKFAGPSTIYATSIEKQ
ncbi:MAG: hypothetical protein NWF06_11320 [Candidatus Bathyarchaeota archaeon]|nr:hypothetical protein [Candidatus Bathyarchaeum sp.]